jgi:UDP-glucose 4-epimerase
MKVLVTGGLGYIGSHTVVELAKKGYLVHIIDDLSNSNIEVLERLEMLTNRRIMFHKINLQNQFELKNFFEEQDCFDGVIHFAANKFVGESVSNPLKYYKNNIGSLINLLNEIVNNGMKNLIFSSSCTVYGQSEKMPLSENSTAQKIMSPYGNTKKIGEEIIRDVCSANNLNSILLRYFNPIGAHPSGLIGESPNGTPQNLIPYLTQTAIGKRERLSVYGNDYPTKDGTPLRDYIDIVDLAEAHVLALDRLIESENKENTEVFNLGTGAGVSVLEVIDSFEKATGVKLPYQIVDRRKGDVIEAYANTDRANKILNWKAVTPLEKSLLTAWNWEKNQSQKFDSKNEAA